MQQQELVTSFISKYPGTRSCFILGSTGETGKRLTRNLISSGAFSLVKVISRRQLPEQFLPEAPFGVKAVSRSLRRFALISLV